MNGTAMIPDSQSQRCSVRLGIRGGIIACGRGLALGGLMLAGLVLLLTERAVAKRTASIFLKLGLQPSDDDNRRVVAVLAYLGR